MFGKLAGAFLGERLAKRHQGAKGALIGYGAVALARRSIPALAAVSLAGWGYRRWRERRAGRAAYPAEASPASPSGAAVS